MTLNLEYLTEGDIDARISELLSSINMTLDELRRKGAAFALDRTERGVLDEIEDLEFLRTGD
jgi:hypothetical protein